MSSLPSISVWNQQAATDALERALRNSPEVDASAASSAALEQ